MKRFNSHTVRASKHLQAKTDKEKAAMRRANGTTQRWAADDAPILPFGAVATMAPKEYLAPMREDYKPPRLRGRSGTRLDPRVRAIVAARREGRKAFFAELGVRV